MNITFVSADDTIRMTFGIDPRSAVTDLTKIEKELGKDLTDVIQKAIDVAFNVTSQTFTRGPKNAYIVSYSWTLYPIYEGRVVEDNAVKSISVTIGDSDHNLYEFEGVGDHDVDAMITWLRKEHQVYYTPNDELLNEKKKWAEKVAKQQKKIDSYESTLSKITDIMEPKYAGPAWSETWDDLVERIKRLKTEHDDVRGLSLNVDYQNAKAARAELAYLYKTVLGKEKLDRDLSPHEVMKAILDAVKKLRDAQFASDQCLRSVYMHVYEDIGYEVSDIYAAPDKLAECIITRYNSARMSSRLVALSEIDDHIDELCDKYNVVQPDRKSVTKERLDYIFGVLAEHRDLANNNFNKAEGFRKEKKEFLDSVCEVLNIAPCMTYKQILTEIKNITDDADRYDELEYFRADICEVLGIDAGELFGSPQQNDKYILAQAEKLKKTPNQDAFRYAVCNALGMPTTSINGNIIGRIRLRQDCHNKLCKDYTELRKAIWEAMDRKPETLPEENARLVGEVRMLQLNDISLKWMHDEVAKAIDMDYPVTNNDIVNRVKSLYDANGSSCDVDVISDLKRQVVELARGKKLLIEFRDDVAKAIGMDYPTTNQVILNNVQYIYKDRDDAYKIVSKLNNQVTALSKAKEDLQQMLIASQKDAKGWTNRCICLADTHSEMQAFRRNAIDDLKTRGFFFRYEEDETLPEIFDKLLKRYDWAHGEYKEQYRLRQMWHVRWESENERANGEHKSAEKLRKDVTALTNRIELLKISNASQANSIVASQAFKNECRKLKEEKAKVIAALGQDIWDDCVK